MESSKKHPTGAAVKFWSWLFPITYLIHIAEEYWGGEGYSAYILRIRGVHLSTTRFLVAQSIGFFLVTLAIILARQLNFPQTMLLILGTVVLVNGVTHAVTSLTVLSYGPGLFSSVFIWIPLGVATLLRFRNSVSRQRFWLMISIGVVINLLIGVITMSGGRVS